MASFLFPQGKRVNSIYNFIALAIFITVTSLLLKGFYDMNGIYNMGDNYHISLSPSELPYYTLRTTMRLLYGLVASLSFAIIFGVLAAKYKHFEVIILPFINFMESVPLVGFLTFTTIFFLGLFPHSVMGLEYAAIFGVFTSQSWNMCLVVYQTLKIVPYEMHEAAKAFHYNPWQKFWKIELPYSMPGLLWNTMVSQSAAWFALIATEAIPVKSDTVALPGVGSYIHEALAQGNLQAIILSILAIIINIIIIDQLLFRPMVRYCTKFKYEDVGSENANTSWFYDCLVKSTICQYIGKFWRHISFFSLFSAPNFIGKSGIYNLKVNKWVKKSLIYNWYIVVAGILAYGGYQLWLYFPKEELSQMPSLMALTAWRVFSAMALSILFFVPLGVWIGLNSKRVRIFQPIIQILAALPLNLFYPLLAAYLAFTQQVKISDWVVIFLIMLGTQWYVLFNVIAGVSTLPNQMLDLSKSFSVTGWMWWRKFLIPSIFPYIVTGIISAAGGAWNAAIASEIVIWGSHKFSTTGLGAYIQATTDANQLPQAALGCFAMIFMVGLLILFVWRPLYRLAEDRYKIS
jgi:NitT/TauT family transport system permease protein